MKFKQELKANIENTIDSYDKVILDINLIKSQLTFNSEQSQEEIHSRKRKIAFPLFIVPSLILGLGIGSGVTYILKENFDQNNKDMDQSNFFEVDLLDQKKCITFEIENQLFDVCYSFMKTHLYNQYYNLRLIDENNQNTIEKVILKYDKKYIAEPSKSIDASFSNLILCSKDNIDYFYFMSCENQQIIRYRVQSNLPYTMMDLKAAFESQINAALTDEFLNSEDSGIFSEVKYDSDVKKYYLSYELNYESQTYVAKYDETLKQIVVKKLV